jgi:hypothetical protein
VTSLKSAYPISRKAFSIRNNFFENFLTLRTQVKTLSPGIWWCPAGYSTTYPTAQVTSQKICTFSDIASVTYERTSDSYGYTCSNNDYPHFQRCFEWIYIKACFTSFSVSASLVMLHNTNHTEVRSLNHSTEFHMPYVLHFSQKMGIYSTQKWCYVSNKLR